MMEDTIPRFELVWPLFLTKRWMRRPTKKAMRKPPKSTKRSMRLIPATLLLMLRPSKNSRLNSSRRNLQLPPRRSQQPRRYKKELFHLMKNKKRHLSRKKLPLLWSRSPRLWPRSLKASLDSSMAKDLSNCLRMKLIVTPSSISLLSLIGMFSNIQLA